MAEDTKKKLETEVPWSVTLDANGGIPAIREYSFAEKTFSEKDFEVPTRPGKVFTGWYEDVGYTKPFSRSNRCEKYPFVCRLERI